MTENNKIWQLHDCKRWKISAQLETVSCLHVGSGFTFNHPDLVEPDQDKRPIDINAIVKDYQNKPCIPGSTIKGKLSQWLHRQLEDTQYSDHLPILLGTISDRDNSGQGGRAEFHHAVVCHELKLNDKAAYPYWNENSQTCIEVSNAIDRTTRTVVDKKLFHTELVPPGIRFTCTISGLMTDTQAGIIIAALKAFQKPEQAACFGAETASGNGKMTLFANVEVCCMDQQGISQWLEDDTDQMAEQAMQKLSKEQAEELAEPIINAITSKKERQKFSINLKFDGPFLVNDPPITENTKSDEFKHKPLQDKDGNPLIPVKSFRGALRFQAEKIIRTLGGQCCDTSEPCKPIYNRVDLDKLCLACQIFGATGWQTTLHLSPFKFKEALLKEETQTFVAIDRFTGGGKAKALYNAQFSLQPEFSSTFEIDQRMPEWGYGLLALVFRDLKEGDIKIGFGSNKGFGGIEQAEINPDNFANKIELFRDKCKKNQQTYPCKAVSVPLPKSISEQAENSQPDKPNSNEKLFLNPYHFIPIGQPDTRHWLEAKNLTNQAHHSHAIYRQQTETGQAVYHGCINCKLTTDTPFFIGAKSDYEQGAATNNGLKKLQHYRLNNAIAIPATSLRGLISALSESASNSSLRVLDNGLLSYRKPVESALSALGMVINGEKDGEYQLIPLTLPTLVQKGNYYCQPNEYRKMFTNGPAPLKVYFDSTNEQQSWKPDEHKIYYLDLDTLHINLNNNQLETDYPELLRHPSKDNEKKFIIGQNPVSSSVVSNNFAPGLTPGILRILGKEHRELPDTVQHDLFIPVPKAFVDNLDDFIKNTKSFEISSIAVERFNQLADQCTDSQKNKQIEHQQEHLPYHLKGTSRNSDHKLHLKHGDLVYFRPDEDHPEQVAEVSFSSIWRGRTEMTNHQAAKVQHFFHSEMLPFHKDRKYISPAELLFGFTELNEEKPNNTQQGKAFAGKVRITAAQCSETVKQQEPSVVLKILASPKLPSPAMYFQPRNNKNSLYIRKDKLCPEQHKPNGRKQYLHALQNYGDSDSNKAQKLLPNGEPCLNKSAIHPWISQDETKDQAQKVSINPVEPGTVFNFNVEFDNLTEWELGLLCYALKPNNNYRHKLGMGKPIGLGSIKIDIEELKIIDRLKRYQQDELNNCRYQTSAPCWKTLREIFSQTMDAGIRNAIELLGNPAKVTKPVHYPQVKDKDIEQETYRWFVANDIGSGMKKDNTSIPPKKETLEPISNSSKDIPSLHRHPWVDPK